MTCKRQTSGSASITLETHEGGKRNKYCIQTFVIIERSIQRELTGTHKIQRARNRFVR